MSHSENQAWLHRFAMLTAVATLALIGVGGLVTSHEAGMSVPDWPTSYGYNMFLFPVSKWWHVGNVFYEHSHRLFASGVGLLTTILAVWLCLKETRAWLRWLGVIAFFAVVLQGVLGGLRVVWFKDQIGIFHAMLAQLFFCLACAIALFTSKWWRDGAVVAAVSDHRPISETNAAVADRRHNYKLGRLAVFATVLIFLQLILGATMRHQHAGLAIPDFPLAHGRLWPAADPQSVLRYNQQRVEVMSVKPITAFQIELQMTHRFMAALILAAVTFCAWRARTWRRREAGNTPARLAYAWLGLILVQAGLGAATVWSDKAADVATAHVLVGAISLAAGVITCIILSCSPELKREARGLSSEMERAPVGSFVQ